MLKLKAIEWETTGADPRNGLDTDRTGFHEFGYYSITGNNRNYSLSTWTNKGRVRQVGVYNTVGDAKLAAQADLLVRTKALYQEDAVSIETVQVFNRDEFSHWATTIRSTEQKESIEVFKLPTEEAADYFTNLLKCYFFNGARPKLPDAAVFGKAAPHGWICYNSGPCEWFWSEDRNQLVHELSDDIRPATHLEKYFLNKIGNRTHEHDDPAGI